MMSDQDFKVFDYPPVRQFTADTGRLDHERHFVRALLEVDVTDALQKIKALRAPGKKVSFLAWFIKVTADAAAQHPPINGVHRGRSRVVAFTSVDISTVVEKSVEGVAVPLPLVLRSANEKTYFQINDEIQAAVAQAVVDEGNLVLGKGQNAFFLKLAAGMPQWLRLWILRRFILGNPLRMQAMMGTVMITSLGTVGRYTGWIIPTSMHPLSIGIGTLNKKPVVHQGEIQKREILHLTVSIDHDVIDGMPAFKFVDDLISRLEAGEGLSV
jgi:pyruvate/2-oxoglutarate dehydrogenase complex dihydrolipoamide acyltransferase (E2) component